MKKQTFKKIFSFIGFFSFMFLFLVNLANAQGVDRCPNIPGNQVSIPPNHTLIAGECVNTHQLNANNQLKRTSDTYEPLAELPGLTDLNFSQECPLVDYINTIFQLLIGIIIIIAMVKLVLGGLEYITSESISGKANAKESIINAFAGLVIALGAYLILNTINPTLLNLCPKIDKAVQVIDEDVPQTAVNGYYGNGKYKKGADWDESIAGTIPALPRGVTVNKQECTEIGQQNCTSIRGLNTLIINRLANKCWESNGNKDCNIVITGGTENWLHSATGTHRPGSPTIDLSPTVDVNKYLTGNTTPPPPNTTIGKDGVKYYYHANYGGGGYHWHVYQ